MLYGTSHNLPTLQRMCMYWGVTPIATRQSADHFGELDGALKAIQKQDDIPNGTRAVVTGGIIVNQPGATSVMEVREFGKEQQHEV